jgi:hypothetical protein
MTMFRRITLAMLAITAPLVPVAPALAYERLPTGLAQLSPADFASKVQIIDDPVEPAIVLSTRDGYTQGRSIKGARAEEVYLQALVDRKTGAVSWRVWHELSMGSQRKISSVQYQTEGRKLEQAEFLTMENWLDQCPPTDGIGSCNHFVRVAFELPDQTIREIANAYRPGERTPWGLRFKDANGRDILSGLAPAEAAGLIRSLETWNQSSNKSN